MAYCRCGSVGVAMAARHSLDIQVMINCETHSDGAIVYGDPFVNVYVLRVSRWRTMWPARESGCARFPSNHRLQVRPVSGQRGAGGWGLRAGAARACPSCRPAAERAVAGVWSTETTSAVMQHHWLHMHMRHTLARTMQASVLAICNASLTPPTHTPLFLPSTHATQPPCLDCRPSAATTPHTCLLFLSPQAAPPSPSLQDMLIHVRF